MVANEPDQVPEVGVCCLVTNEAQHAPVTHYGLKLSPVSMRCMHEIPVRGGGLGKTDSFNIMLCLPDSCGTADSCTVDQRHTYMYITAKISLDLSTYVWTRSDYCNSNYIWSDCHWCFNCVLMRVMVPRKTDNVMQGTLGAYSIASDNVTIFCKKPVGLDQFLDKSVQILSVKQTCHELCLTSVHVECKRSDCNSNHALRVVEELESLCV